MDSTQVVKVLLGEFDLLLQETILHNVGRLSPLDALVQGIPQQATVEIGESLRPLTNEVPHLAPAFQRQGEPLEQLGAVDRMKHADIAQFLAATPGLQVAVDPAGMGQVGVCGMADIRGSQFLEKVGKPPHPLTHGNPPRIVGIKRATKIGTSLLYTRVTVPP